MLHPRPPQANLLELGGSIAPHLPPSSSVSSSSTTASATAAASLGGAADKPIHSSSGSCVNGEQFTVGAGSDASTAASRRSNREVVGVRRAVVLVASQKTLVMAVAVLSGLGVGGGGLVVVPCVLAHLGQVVVDSALVSYWQQQDRLGKPSAA